MSNRNRALWPYRPLLSIVAMLIILILLLIGLGLSREAFDWPTQRSENITLLAILLISLIPVILVLVDTLVESGARVQYKEWQIDFSQVKESQIDDFRVPTNIGVAGQPVPDSGSAEILETLNQAINSESVIVDLEDGTAWWETRLLVLVVGATRHGSPNIIVFLGTKGEETRRFLGWAYSSKLLPYLLNADRRYRVSYYSALAVAKQWELVEPVNEGTLNPAQPTTIKSGSLADGRLWMAFENGLPNAFLTEQLLASDLSQKIESVESNRSIAISSTRLEDLFGAVLNQETVDETWTPERQFNEFFANSKPYIGITDGGEFQRLVSRTTVLNTAISVLMKNGES